MMIEFREGFDELVVKKFFTAINETSMKRPDFDKFLKAYQSRDVVLSLWDGQALIGFGSMLTDWTMNSIIYDVVVVEEFQKRGFGKKIMQELMTKAPDTRFYLTSTFGNEEFYKNMGFRKHKTAFALYPGDSPYLE
jgi:GNAT superfamily N-acetyltransferase